MTFLITTGAFRLEAESLRPLALASLGFWALAALPPSTPTDWGAKPRPGGGSRLVISRPLLR